MEAETECDQNLSLRFDLKCTVDYGCDRHISHTVTGFSVSCMVPLIGWGLCESG